MAKIEITKPASEHFPASTETVEVRVWELGGTDEQPFYIGSGVNYQASGVIWLEIIYTLEGAPLLYTRNFLHHLKRENSTASLLECLDAFAQAGDGRFGLGDILPETRIALFAEQHSYKDDDGQKKADITSRLEVSADTSAVFGRSGPGDNWVEIRLDYIQFEDGVRFMRELIMEIAAVQQGRRPDPACLPPGSSEWPFVWQMNRQAYNQVASEYQEAYFENPLLREAFDGWLSQIPPGGHILDAGCGHGDPVIARLLDKGFQVTGSDFSPEMLRLAKERFPQVKFVNQTHTTLDIEAPFDGACSFSSLLYLDPIDFTHSIYRLHKALKPGGILFLYGYDGGPDWRGVPFRIVLKQWMWSWHYGMQEVAGRLEEHGYFEVIDMCRVQVDEEEERRVEQEIEKIRHEREERARQRAEDKEGIILPYISTPLPERPGYAYVVIARSKSR